LHLYVNKLTIRQHLGKGEKIKMNKIEILNRFTREVIFSHESENNTINLTDASTVKSGINISGANLRYANISGADLRGANISGADLRGADLRGANISGANLRCTNISGADLSGANISGANLRGANINGADLRGADISGADLRGATGNQKEIKTINTTKYTIVFSDEKLAIGCQQHSIEEWKEFTDDEISEMDNGALEWWNRWSAFIFTAIELSDAEK